MAVNIKKLEVFQNFDSKGFPCLYGELTLSDNRMVHTSIPNNQENGKYAANYLYDEERFFNGRGISRNLKYLNELIAPKLAGTDPLRSRDIDAWLLKADPTENKSVLGVNSLLLVSQLVYKAGALAANLPLYQYLNKVYQESFSQTNIKLPAPIFNLVSGGRHGADTLSFQEFAVIFSTSISFSQALVRAVELYHEVADVFSYRNIFSGSGDSGAYVPRLSANIDALEIIKEAIYKQGWKIGMDIFFVLDLAAGFFYKNTKYYMKDSPNPLSSEQLGELLQKIFKEYRLLIIEDPFAEEDYKGWSMLNETLGERVYLVGDDLIAMNKKRLEMALSQKLCNTVNVKLTQRGTVWEAMEFIAAAKKGNLKTIVSQSAYETNDTFIADFAVGVGADFAKFGPPVRGERVAKYNRLLAIERESEKKIPNSNIK